VSTGTPRAQAPASAVRFRRNVDRLTAGQLSNLRAGFGAMYELADDRGYAHHAGIHGLPLPIGCDNAHGTPYFLPWHRAYLYFFERALRDRVERATLAWWDWRTGPQRPAQVPQAFRARTLDGQGNRSTRRGCLGWRWSRAGGPGCESPPARGASRATPRCFRGPKRYGRCSSCVTSWTSRLRSRGCMTGCTSGSVGI
jgi:Common central domain of tyrosinase